MPPPLSSFEASGQGLAKLPPRPPLSSFDIGTAAPGKIKEQDPMGAGERFMTGLADPVIGGKQLYTHATGTPQQISAIDTDVQKREQEIARRAGGGLVRGLGAATTTLPLAATGFGGVGGAIAGGAAGAALQPVDPAQKPWMQPTGSQYLDQKIQDSLLGGIFGGATAGFGRAFSPVLSSEAKALQAAGVNLTPGQMYGGKGIEEVAQKFPILGNFIRGAYGRQAESWRRSIGDQVLEPLGQTASPKVTGRDLVSDVGSKIDAAYHSVLPKISAVPDNVFMDKLRVTADFARELPPAQRQQFSEIIRNRLSPIFNYQQMPGTIQPNGEIYKQADSALRMLGDKYIKSSDAGQQEMGRLLYDVRAAMRDLAMRQNPTVAPELRKADAAYAMYMRMVDASTRRAGSGGEFTPADLMQVVAGGKASRRGAFARGDALMQTYAEAANKVLPSKIQPQLGIPEIVAGTAGGTELLHNPLLAAKVIAGGTAAGLPYTPAGIAVLNALSRVPGGSAVRKGLPFAGAGVGAGERQATYGGPQE